MTITILTRKPRYNYAIVDKLEVNILQGVQKLGDKIILYHDDVVNTYEGYGIMIEIR